MSYSNIKLSTTGPVATLVLNRPDALNALSPPMIAEIVRALGEVAEDQGVKALVVRGEGRSFCAGADLNAMDRSFADDASLRH